LKIALENLLGNAWKYTRKVPDARVEFGMVEHGGTKAFFVRDNGMMEQCEWRRTICRFLFSSVCRTV